MNIEDQVCSLELARRLKELGVKQKSIIFWLNIQHCIHMKINTDDSSLQEDENGNPIIDRIDYRIGLGNPYAYNIEKENTWAAFTVAELGEMLPKYTHSAKGDDKNHTWECMYDCGKNYFSKSGAETEANARAKMLIYLLENRLINI